MRFPLDQQVVGGWDYGVDAGYTKNHLGCDWRARFVPLYAPCDGDVVSCAKGPAGGNTMLFKPKGSKTVIRWLHLDVFHVKPGPVKEGTLLATTGNTGQSEAPHLHEDIWPAGVVTLKFPDTMDPKKFYKKADAFTHKFQAMDLGDTSDEVAALQTALQIEGFKISLQETRGKFYGASTAESVLAFQRKHKVAPEKELVALAGQVVGPKTIKVLDSLFK